MKSEERGELLSMLARESYFERQLTLASGRASNYYVDCKRTLYLPRGAYLAGELVLELATAAGVEQIGGKAAGALAVTDAVMAAAQRNPSRADFDWQSIAISRLRRSLAIPSDIPNHLRCTMLLMPRSE